MHISWDILYLMDVFDHRSHGSLFGFCEVLGRCSHNHNMVYLTTWNAWCCSWYWKLVNNESMIPSIFILNCIRGTYCTGCLVRVRVLAIYKKVASSYSHQTLLVTTGNQMEEKNGAVILYFILAPVILKITRLLLYSYSVRFTSMILCVSKKDIAFCR